MSQQTILRVQTNIPSEFTVTGATSLDLQSGSYSGITGSGTLSDPFIYSQTQTGSENGFEMTFQAQCDGTIVISYLSSTAVKPRFSFDNYMSVFYWGNRKPSLNKPISNQTYYGKQITEVKYDVKSGDYLRLLYWLQSNTSGSTVSGSTYFIPNSNSVNYTPPTYDNLDLYGDVPIKINKSFAELQDIGKKNSDFSVNLTLPGTKKNNRFFETFYNVDMSLIFFDVTKRVPCDVLIEDQSYFRGYLKLNKIKVKDSAVEYDVTLYSTVSDIFGKIGNNLLRDLNFNDAQYHFNHQFHWKNIVGQYQLDPNLYNYETPQSYFYPILHNGYNYDGDDVVLSGSTEQTRLYTTSSPIGGYASTSSWYSSGGERWRINSPDDGIIDNQLKPSLTIYNLVKLMFKDYGYTINSKFFETPWFKNLTMYGYFSSPTTKFSYTWQPDNCLPELGVDVLYDDYNNLFHVVKAGTNVPATACQTLTGVIRYQDEYGYDYVDFEIPPGEYSISVPGSFGLFFEGIEMYNFNNWRFGIPDFDPLANEGQNVPVLDDEIVDFSLIMDPKIKQIDFLSSLAKKFNLVFTPSPDYPNEIIIEPYDYYMNTGEIHDWTEKLSYDQGFTVEPALNYIESTLKLTDSEDGDDGNKIFKDTYNRLYGEQIVYNTTDFKSTNKEIKTIFSPEVIRTWDSNVGLPLGMNYVGSSSENNGGNVSYQYKGLKSKPKIFYWLGNFPPFIDEVGKLNTLSNINTNILRIAPSNGVTPFTGSTQQFGTVNAPVISPNSTLGNPDENKIINDNISTLFGSEKPVDLGVSTFDTYTANNLYNTFYQNRVQNLYDKNTRFISGKFNLKLSDILNLNPNDLIKIHEQYFTWNKIKEFNMTEPELTQVELIQTNRVIKEYPDRYFIYKYCDGGQYEYKFKTYFDYTEAQQPGGDRYLINGYGPAVMSNYYWATLYDYFVGALGGDVSGYTSVNESGTALIYEIREVTKAEWESTTALLWNLDPAKHGLYQQRRDEPSWENAGFDYPLYMSLGGNVILNLAANCTDMRTYLTLIGRTPSNPPAPPSPTPVPTSTPTPTPTPTEIVQSGIIGEYSLIINYNDDTAPDARLNVYLDYQLRVNRYNNTTPLYMSYSNGDERFEVTVANYNTSLYNNPIVELIRRDYTNDDQNGNMGIVDTIIPIELVNVLPNQVKYDWGTLTTNPDAYNCEYRLSVRTGTLIGEPTPTPTPVVTTTPTPTPTPTPTFCWKCDYTPNTDVVGGQVTLLEFDSVDRLNVRSFYKPIPYLPGEDAFIRLDTDGCYDTHYSATNSTGISLHNDDVYFFTDTGQTTNYQYLDSTTYTVADTGNFDDAVFGKTVLSDGSIIVIENNYTGGLVRKIESDLSGFNTGYTETQLSGGTGGNGFIGKLNDDSILVYDQTSGAGFNIRRINSDGTATSGWTVSQTWRQLIPTIGDSGIPWGCVELSNGDILLFGDFFNWRQTSGDTFTAVDNMVKLNSNGIIDSGFINGGFTFTSGGPPAGGGGNALISDGVELSTGDIVLVGQFDTYSGVTAHGIIKITNIGSINTTFATNVGTAFLPVPNFPLIDRDSNNRIVIGGQFTSYDGNPSIKFLVMLDVNGTNITCYTDL